MGELGLRGVDANLSLAVAEGGLRLQRSESHLRVRGARRALALYASRPADSAPPRTAHAPNP